MSGLGIAAVLLVMGLVVAVEIAIVVRVARRLIPLARRFTDPAQRAALLSAETRAALERAGVDPASLDPKALADSPELSAQIAQEIREALRAALRGRGAEPSSQTPGAAAFEPSRPPPIDGERGAGLRHAAALALLGLGAAAIWYWLA
jgi:hypothetical protein